MTPDSNSDPSVSVQGQNSDRFSGRVRIAIDDESVRGFAQRAGIAPTTLQDILNGSLPRLDTLLAIASAANVGIEWLATGKGEMRPASAELARIDRDLARLDSREALIRRQHADDPDAVLYRDVEIPRQALMKRREEILAATRQEPAAIDLELLTTSIRDVESLVAALQDNATPAEKASLAAKWYRIQLKDRAEGKGAPAASLIDLVRKAS